ncbi:MAG: hypothetical protein PVH68_12975 [Armatimonadota bacterium]|jgi:dienelactone hydrolase
MNEGSLLLMSAAGITLACSACAGQPAPEVDGERLGLTGHSMGGRLTVLSAIDPRVKAATPSVGGSGFLCDDLWGLPGSGRHMREDLDLYNRTIDCRAYWPSIACPILFLGATNDFNSPLELVVQGMSLLKHNESRLVLAPHLDHRFTSSTFAARPLWFEAHLKGDFEFPKAAKAELALRQPDHIPLLAVYPDATTPHRLVSVDIYYGYGRDPRNRFWRDGLAEQVDDHWEGRCPVMQLDEPLFAFANAAYETHRAIPLPRGYGPACSRVTIASEYRIARPDDLRAARVRATQQPQRLIDWDEITELGLTSAEKALEQDKSLLPWEGEVPQFRDLRWVGGVYVPRTRPYLPEAGSREESEQAGRKPARARSPQR